MYTYKEYYLDLRARSAHNFDVLNPWYLNYYTKLYPPILTFTEL